MIRSSSRLAVVSVLTFFVISFVVLAAYVRGQTWTEERIRQDGVFLVFEQLDQAAPDDRAKTLKKLTAHSWRTLRLTTTDEVQELAGKAPPPGGWLRHKESAARHWALFVFSDGSGALMVGPVHPAIPPGVVPVGALLLLFVPFLGAFVAARIERELSKVESASQAIAAGDLDARVDNEHGPSSELAASFNAMAVRIERLVHSRDELVQAVSHELGSPLSRLRFHVELLAQAQTDASRLERTEAVSHELDRLDDLVAELLGFVQYDEQKLHREVFDPTSMLNDLAELAHLDAPDGRDIRVDVEVATNVSVDADPKLFQRVVENLLRNAARYAKRAVLVSVTMSDGIVIVAVDDDGPGIPESHRKDVLTPFVRLDADRGRRSGGAGLGLAIVQRILERHGGDVVIDDGPMGGARVRTTWPTSSV